MVSIHTISSIHITFLCIDEVLGLYFQVLMSVKVYGFMSWMLAIVGAVVWCIWAYMPDSMLRSVGISYIPSKWWAVAFPTFLLVTLFMFTFMYSASFFFVAPALNSKSLLVDTYSHGRGPERKGFEIPSARDLPLGRVNHLMWAPVVQKAIEAAGFKDVTENATK